MHQNRDFWYAKNTIWQPCCGCRQAMQCQLQHVSCQILPFCNNYFKINFLSATVGVQSGMSKSKALPTRYANENNKTPFLKR
jgi:hypothetical protein